MSKPELSAKSADRNWHREQIISTNAPPLYRKTRACGKGKQPPVIGGQWPVNISDNQH
jgi:hypothetical protein